MKVIFLISFSLYLLAHGYAQEDTVKSYTTERVSGEAPKMDGFLNDKAWEQVPWGGGNFTQRSPDDGAIPSVQTKFKILYDAKNLYIAFKNLDPDPEKIVKRMSRRDGFEGDWVEVNIDSYYDKRTAFSFTASVSGVKGDEYVSNNGGDWDTNWDPIWYLKTSINEEGWVAELRIPLSQLRFADQPEHIWGLQITRRFFRNNERSNWQYVPQDASGWVHLFGELRGIKGIKPQKQLEIQPYVVAKTERFKEEKGNPFATGKSSDLEFGVDAKIGITSDITLDLTVNPDFGQVEADPSQVNLSAFRLFFPEQRPFFIEGNNILTFPVVDFNNNNLFYSRRIGRSPQGSVDLGDDPDNKYVKAPGNTSILGAAKLTGKNKNGLSWGILESVTDKVYATLDSLGFRREETIEPLTNYFLARAQQDINEGNTLVGGMLTATHRDINDDHLDHLHREAYSGGIDFTHFWKQRTYFISSKVLASYVDGSQQAITRTQQSPERFFQRQDNHHAELDTTRTSLAGSGGTVMFGKRSGKIVYDIGYTWQSPELELNDIGFLSQTDNMTQWASMQYRKLKPFGIFRSFRTNITQYASWDFGGINTERGIEMSGNTEFKNFWFVDTGFALWDQTISNADLRGGPSITYPGGFNQWLWTGTDPRKKIRVVFNTSWGRGFDDYQKNRSVGLDINYRPTNALNISLAPRISHNVNEMQYVSTIEHNNQEKYIVAQIDQNTYNMSFRLTYMVTPNLSVQYWGQPFASSGSYTDFKRITQPDAENYNSRFSQLQAVPDQNNDKFHFNESGDGNIDYSIGNPDFNFAQFRSNMVVRWEYIPGSTLFLVWTQNRTESPSTDFHTFDHLYSGLFDKQPHNVFLLKYTYRFVL